MIMNDDPEVASLYREVFDEVKFEKEEDEIETKRVHDRFDYLYDRNDESMGLNLKNKKYHVEDFKKKEDELLTETDLSEPLLEDIYSRYKLAVKVNKETHVDVINRLEDQLRTFATTGRFDYNGTVLKNINQVETFVLKQLSERNRRKKLDVELESLIAQIRIANKLKKLRPVKVYHAEEDRVYGN